MVFYRKACWITMHFFRKKQQRCILVCAMRKICYHSENLFLYLHQFVNAMDMKIHIQFIASFYSCIGLSLFVEMSGKKGNSMVFARKRGCPEQAAALMMLSCKKESTLPMKQKLEISKNEPQ